MCRNLIRSTALAVACLMASLCFASTYEATENIQTITQPFTNDSLQDVLAAPEVVAVEYVLFEKVLPIGIEVLTQGRVAATLETHTLEYAGSNPAPATSYINRHRRE